MHLHYSYLISHTTPCIVSISLQSYAILPLSVFNATISHPFFILSTLPVFQLLLTNLPRFSVFLFDSLSFHSLSFYRSYYFYSTLPSSFPSYSTSHNTISILYSLCILFHTSYSFRFFPSLFLFITSESLPFSYSFIILSLLSCNKPFHYHNTLIFVLST